MQFFEKLRNIYWMVGIIKSNDFAKKFELWIYKFDL